jgi:ABC-2 type transport system ATP-binding protein
MRQRLQVARILLHDPAVLVLDEPASDLDPRARIEIRDLLLELRELGKTIFLSSHILTELSDVCTSVGILEHGRLIVSGPIQDIAAELEARRAEGHARSLARPDASAALPEAAPVGPAETSGEPGLTAGGVAVPPAAQRRLRLRVLGEAEAVVPLIAGGTGIDRVEPSRGGQLFVYYYGDQRFVAELVRHLVAHGVGIVGVEPERNELERLFLEATEGRLQ